MGNVMNADSKSLENTILSQIEDDDHKYVIKRPYTTTTEESSESTKLISGTLKWTHIASAIMHELDENISFILSNVVKKLKITQVQFCTEIKQQLIKTLHKDECMYIESLVKRAIKNTSENLSFSPVSVRSNIISSKNNNNILNDIMLMDIFNVHRVHKFSNYHFEEFTKNEFIQAIVNNKFLDEANRQQIVNIFENRFEQSLKFELYPKWLIDDDQFAIFNYFFCSSYLVNKLRNDSSVTNIKFLIYIVPKRIISLYDHNKTFHVNIKDID
eukprot:263223_1